MRMKIIPIYFYLPALFLVHFNFSKAQSADQTLKLGQKQSLSWQDCVQILKKNNLAIQQAQEKWKAAQQTITTSQSGYFPKIYGSLSQSTSYLSSTGQSDTAQMNLNLTQNLFSGFSDVTKSNLAKQKTITANLNQLQTELAALEELKIAYSRLSYAQDYLKLAQKILARRNENYKMVDLRYGSGRENKGSLQLSEAYFAQAQYDILLADSQLKIAQADLKKILNLPEDTNAVEIQTENVSDMVIEKSSDFLSMVNKNYDFQKAKSDEATAQFNLRSAKSEFFPSLDFTASTGKTDSSWTPNQNKWSTSLTLTIPLFDGFKDYSTVRAHAATLKAAELLKESTHRDLLNKIQQSFSDAKLAQEKVKVDQVFQKAARTRSEIARKKYNNGLMSFEEWDQVENDLILREKSLLTSQRDFWKSYSGWVYLISQTQEVSYE